MVRTRRDEGASAVEFALVVPILVLFLVGIIQFGVIFFQWIECTHAAREGARWASLRKPWDEVVARTKGAAPGLDAASIQVLRSPIDYATRVGQPVTITVRYPAPVFTPGMRELFGSGATLMLVSSATQRVE